MMKKIFLFLWICGLNVIGTFAQESVIETEMLNDTIKSEPPILLNPEFQQKIESGTFLQFNDPASKAGINPLYPLSEHNLYGLEKDFSEYIRPDSAWLDRINPWDIPPAVLKLYGLDSTPDKPLKSFQVSEQEKEYLKSIYPGGMKFSAEHMLRYLFWKSERAKVRNRKRAKAWKYYNTQPVY